MGNFIKWAVKCRGLKTGSYKLFPHSRFTPDLLQIYSEFTPDSDDSDISGCRL